MNELGHNSIEKILERDEKLGFYLGKLELKK
jgi:hypothetical protein